MSSLSTGLSGVPSQLRNPATRHGRTRSRSARAEWRDGFQRACQHALPLARPVTSRHGRACATAGGTFREINADGRVSRHGRDELDYPDCPEAGPNAACEAKKRAPTDSAVPKLRQCPGIALTEQQRDESPPLVSVRPLSAHLEQREHRFKMRGYRKRFVDHHTLGVIARAALRYLTLLLISVFLGCATVGQYHGSGESVSWSLARSYSAQGSTTDVCASGKPAPCILERSTDERTTYARFSLHVFGPKATTFQGTVVFSYLNDADPSRYKTVINLTSNNQDVHHHTFSRVTTVPGEYSVRVHLEESGPASAQPRQHELVVPVTVR